MAGINDAWAERHRRRWMLPNAHRFIRHDAWRFMPAGAPRLTGKDVVRYFWPDAQAGQPPESNGSEDIAALRAEREHATQRSVL